MPTGIYPHHPPRNARLSLSVPKELAAKLRQEAKDGDGSVSHALADILRNYFTLQDSMNAIKRQ